MIHIEKIHLKNFSQPQWSALNSAARGQTFVEYLNENSVNVTVDKPLWYYRKTYLAKEIKKVLPSKIPNIHVSKYFGINGIELDQLLMFPPTHIENLVLELPVDYLPAISRKRLKLLLENYTVMFNDFEEFCTTYGVQRSHIVNILNEHNIKPKCLILVGAPFQMDKDYKDLNIYTVPFDYWLLVSVAVQDFFLKAVTNPSYKEQLMMELHNPSVDHCAIPIFKPRKHRIELLTHLDKIGALEKCDWSFPYNQSKKFNSYLINPLGHDTDDLDNILSEDEKSFLKKYNFPKELEFDENWKLKESPRSETPTITAPEWFNRYKFILVSETYIGNEIEPIMGGCANLTEKTFKTLLYGSIPIIHGGKGSADYLEKLGFKTQFSNYDSSNVEEIGKLILEINKNPTVDKNIVFHNFDRITDLEFLTSVITSPLSKIADLINSIRR